MGTKRTIKARDIVNDIRAGLTNVQLMEKYQLSSKGLVSIFSKLSAAKATREEELQERTPLAADTVALDQKRLLPRNHLYMRLPIVESGDASSQGRVRDISEKGVQVAGIPANPGEIKRFIVKSQKLTNIDNFSFDAQCRWVRKEESGQCCVGGFEITAISESAAKDLRKLAEVMAFSD
jgi:hypothetical protein